MTVLRVRHGQLASAQALNRVLLDAFEEDAILRIDHDLGKEAVQNILYFRFANAALRLDVDSWRWAGIPFFVRAGKSLALTATEVFVEFRVPPQVVFKEAAPSVGNYVRFRLGPQVAIALEYASLTVLPILRLSVSPTAFRGFLPVSRDAFTSKG